MPFYRTKQIYTYLKQFGTFNFYWILVSTFIKCPKGQDLDKIRQTEKYNLEEDGKDGSMVSEKGREYTRVWEELCTIPVPFSNNIYCQTRASGA